jgi:hypothetical protein
MIQHARAVLLILLLAGCSLGAGPGKNSSPVAGNPITGSAIATTSLDAPIPEAGKTVAAEPAIRPSEAAKPEASSTPISEEPQVSLPPEALACAKKGDKWLSSSKGIMSCVHFTKDSGKACQKQSQCEGYCLARSGTCAPVTPMFGCNEILQNDGVRSTICLD